MKEDSIRVVLTVVLLLIALAAVLAGVGSNLFATTQDGGNIFILQDLAIPLPNIP